ncbi:hypothetical protein Tco_0469655 [Tanacetum coccineum]
MAYRYPRKVENADLEIESEILRPFEPMDVDTFINPPDADVKDEIQSLVSSNVIVSALFDQSVLLNPVTMRNNVGVAPTTQSRKEYHKSYYQRHKQKNIATDVSEENNNSQDDPYDFVYNGLPKEHFLLKE